MILNKIADLHNMINTENDKNKIVLCAAGDEHALKAVIHAYKESVIIPILVGFKKDIEATAALLDFDLDLVEVYYERSLDNIIKKSVQLVVSGYADILMKGHVSTSKILSGVLNKEWGIHNVNSFLSHLAIFEIPEYHKLLAITDVAMNIAPTLKHKIRIINNSIEFLQKLGLKNPKIAALAAVEMVNEKMPATTDAALLSIMQRRGQIRNCEIDGPLAFDNAISFESKKSKGLKSNVAGNADVLLVPNIEAGNMLYKSFAFFAKAKVCGVVLGAPFPLVLTSRADSEETKFNSILLAAAASSSL